MTKYLHDNKGNRLVVMGTQFFVFHDNGRIAGPFKSYSGAAKHVTGYEVNGRKYWKFDNPLDNAPRWQLVCRDNRRLVPQVSVLQDGSRLPMQVHDIHTLDATTGHDCDPVWDRFIPDNPEAAWVNARRVLVGS